MAHRERISPVDTAWLRMDRPHNLMMIAGVMMLDGHLDVARLKRTLQARLIARYRRFRQKAVLDASGAWWEDDPEFDIDAHVKRGALPTPADKAELERYVADLVATPLDANRPLWQYVVLENFEGGSAIVVRIHHCIADGIALIHVLLSMTDATPDAPEPAVPPSRVEAEADDPFWRQFVAPVTDAWVTGMKWSSVIWSKYWNIVFNPGQLVDYTRTGGAVAAELAQLALMPNDAPTRFKGRPGLAKRVAWSEPLPLADIKAVGKALGGSVNDVLLACVAGALRGYLADHGDMLEGVEIRALVPVNLRAPEQAGTLGNRFGLIGLLLPVGEANPIARVTEVRERMDALKQSYQAPITLGLLAVLGLAPKAVQTQIIDLLAAKASAVMTNVPGPQAPLYLAGSRLAQQMFWVPQSGDIGMGVSILSYNGKVQFGLITDRKLVPDPENIVNRFAPEFEKLAHGMLLGPLADAPAAKTRARRSAPAEEAVAPAAKPRKRAPARRKAEAAGVPAAAPVPEAPAAPRVPKRFR